MEAEEVRDSLLHVAGRPRPDARRSRHRLRAGPDLAQAEPLLHPPRRGPDAVPRAVRRPRCLRRLPTDDLGGAPAGARPGQQRAAPRPQPKSWPRGCGPRWREASGEDRTACEAFLTAAFEQVLTRPPSPRERELQRSLPRKAGWLARTDCRDGSPRHGPRRRSPGAGASRPDPRPVQPQRLHHDPLNRGA